MDFIADNLLTLILFLPVISAGVIALLPHEEKTLVRWVALISSLIPLVLSLVVWFQFEADKSGFQFADFEQVNTFTGAIGNLAAVR